LQIVSQVLKPVLNINLKTSLICGLQDKGNMKKNIFCSLSFTLIFILCSSAFSQEDEASIFIVPDNLRDNVAFWKKIYTEVSLKEGLIHDRDYPLVIYKRISMPESGSSSRYSESQKARVSECLRHLETQPEETWTEEEKSYLENLKKNAPQGALSGASDRVRFQLGQKERFKQGLERSTSYLDTIRTIFATYGVPQRIAYLPHVESSFNYESYSKVGAAGVWQFMRSTGKLFLKINYLVDERRDPILSTVAAAKLLSSNYRELNSWPLAITAYNHGVNGMKHAESVTGSRDISVIIKNYSSPSFQFASKNFYACFLAASDIAMHASDYFSDIHFEKKVEFRNIKLPSYTRPTVLSRYLGVPVDVLREFNPALRPVVFNQQKQIPADYEIRVPRDIAVASAEKKLADIPDSLKSSEPERTGYYTVQQGDNLYAIASRFSVSLQQLLEENNINRKNRIYEGEVLRIPQNGKQPEAVAAVVQEKPAEPAADKNAEVVMSESSSNIQEVEASNVPSKQNIQTPEPVHEAVKKVKNERASVEKVVVQAVPSVPRSIVTLSDSLKEIALASADTVPRTPVWKKPNVFTKFDVDVYNLGLTISPDGSTAQIKVSVDETIGHYADWLGIPTHRIRQMNHMGGRSDIRINSTIKIPADQPALDRMVRTRLEYHMALEEDFYGRYKVTDVRQHKIKRGENLWDICNGTDPIPLWLFKKYNKQLDLSTLVPGTVVWFPVAEEKSDEEINEDESLPSSVFPAYQAPYLNGNARFFYFLP
jgi:membrane-bound lytic murein transglycosylase D